MIRVAVTRRHDLTDEQWAALATVEHDDINDGDILWLPSADVADLHLFPAVGALLASLDPERPAGAVLLTPLTDDTFLWI